MANKILILLLISFQAYATDFVWHDGDVARTIKLDPQRQAVVETEPANLSGRRAEGMEFLSHRGRLSLYRMVQPSGRGARSTPNRSNLPVFVDSGGIELVPTGGIVLTFKANVSESQIQDFILGQGLNLEKTYQVKGETNYLISSNAGIDTLTLANSLKTHALVKSSSPNWWKNLRQRVIPKNVDRNPKNR